MNRVMIYKKSKKNKNKNQFIGINKINSNESFSQKIKKKNPMKAINKSLREHKGQTIVI